MSTLPRDLQTLLAGLGSPAWLFSLEGRTLGANAAALAALGLRGAGLHAPMVPEDALRLAGALREGGRLAGRFRGRFRTAAGALRMFDLALSPIRASGGAQAVLGLATESAPAGERAPADRAEGALGGGGDDIFRAAAETADFGQWFMDISTRRLWATDTYFRMLGFAPDEVDLDSVWIRARIHPEDRDASIGAMERLVRGVSDQFDMDYRLLCRDGNWRWFHASGRKYHGAGSGLSPIICGSLIDIEARKAAEQRVADALAEAETARLRAEEREEMLRTSAISGRVAHWNICPATEAGWTPEETCRLMGYAPEEFDSSISGWRRLVHPDDLAATTTALRALAVGAISALHHELRLRHGDGRYHWYRTVGRRIDRSDRNLPFILTGAHINIDDLKENERGLAEMARAAQTAHERLDKVTRNVPGGLFEYRVERSGASGFSFFNSKLPEMLGVPAKTIAADGQAFLTHVPPEDARMIRTRLARARRAGAQVEFRHRVNHPQTGLRWVNVWASPQIEPDGAVIWFGEALDITDRLRIEQRAQEAAEEVRRAHDQLSMISTVAPVGLLEARQHADGRIEFTYMNDHFCKLVGLDRDAICGLPRGLVDMVAPEDRAAYAAGRAESARKMKPWTIRFRLMNPQLGTIWLSGSAIPRPAPDGAIIWTGAVSDVTGDMRREAELRHAHQVSEAMRAENEWLALHDGLTGLPNRRYYDRALRERLEECAALGAKCGAALIRIDLDHFKQVNDTWGHEAGDRVLMRVADVLRESLCADDFAARIGGDEFSVMLGVDSPREEACATVARIREGLALPFLYDGRPVRLSASFGIAHVADTDDPGREVQVFADAALYRAKEAGRNRIEVHSDTLGSDIRSLRRLAGELQQALTEGDQLVPFFQPQVDAQSGRLVGVEAVVRWRHPVLGLLRPDAFMRLAEQMRVVADIDRIVMDRSLDAVERWRAQGVHVPKISFNVCSGRLHDPGVVTAVERVAKGPTRVTFELLETILVERESEVFWQHLAAIRAAGIGIEIDDFGAGHASILSLMEIAPASIKIDRRLIAPIAGNFRVRELVRKIVELAQVFEIETVAEGVETPKQAEILRAMGCDLLQGYLFSPPLCERDLAAHVMGLAEA
ncbi:EAL domain-containing protein [Phaeovulum vinaykumarii]|uniref:PAS domain S-box-containing protein/diguanylate cyclase (GGDEF) domain-containing protein n=1 Tax=Phaeovulum vinaykumarii TaxID=407234 RepID=A0A1N7L6Y7_9RHOB|nr:EAL domain-containing protein [Phaeovulum vinaykumarii]SIS69632.1 PAS domain S-box-containing protein/diguanylate cyclase (GGDEF) domain-containing protein [Phaeovulum vinaykumarii]SOB99398.1 PAS domain S-box-containing protein/diguanylate cyclase (GGDEF)-like protein [Phaeovulum vinaykumarii]